MEAAPRRQHRDGRCRRIRQRRFLANRPAKSRYGLSKLRTVCPHDRHRKHPLPPVKVQNRDRAEAEAQAGKLLERVGLLDRKNAYPRELSGGQKQRIAIVRALCLNPEVILLDEITAALDPEMVREVLEVVLELAREGMSMLIVTHEMGFARKVADRIVFMDKGGIVESSDPETFFSAPKSERARQFLAGMDY
ncbi:amino acid ABC transporter ATP-binding protein [Neisseria gonorrhoeae]